VGTAWKGSEVLENAQVRELWEAVEESPGIPVEAFSKRRFIKSAVKETFKEAEHMLLRPDHFIESVYDRVKGNYHLRRSAIEQLVEDKRKNTAGHRLTLKERWSLHAAAASDDGEIRTVAVPVRVPPRLWELQLAAEWLLRGVEASDKADLPGTWSPAVLVINVLTLALEVLFNAVLLSGPAVVEIREGVEHGNFFYEEEQIPLVNVLPLEVLMGVAHGDTLVPKEVRDATWLMVNYSQSWVSYDSPLIVDTAPGFP